MKIFIARHGGGYGDALITTAFITAIRRYFRFNDCQITATSFDAAGDYIKHSGVNYVSSPFDMPDNVEYDLVFDVRSVFKVTGETALLADRDIALMVKSAECLDNYLTKGKECEKLFIDAGCYGQMEMFQKCFGISVTVQDAFVPTADYRCVDGNYAVLCTGFGFKQIHKAWFPNRWKFVIDWLNRHGIAAVQLGRDTEESILGAIQVKELDLNHQLDVMRCAKLAICSDGYFHHAAAALNIPSIVLWGCTPPEVWGYRSQVNIVSPIHENLWNTDPLWFWDRRCKMMMDSIKPEMVTNEIQKLIDIA